MAEVGIEDLPVDIRERFADDDAAQAAIDAVLAAARRYCGWHVSPVKTGDVLTLDGPGSCVLDLPTRRLSAVTSVTEDGASLDVTKLNWSSTGVVRKRSGAAWSGWYRSIVATITHGYAEEEAADWRKAIVDMVTEISYAVSNTSGETSGPLKRKRVDDTEEEWSDRSDEAVYLVGNVLDEYRLQTVMFA